MKYLIKNQSLTITMRVILFTAIPSTQSIVKLNPTTNTMRKFTKNTKVSWKKNRHTTIIRPRNTWSTAKETKAKKTMKGWIIVIIAVMTSDTANIMPP